MTIDEAIEHCKEKEDCSKCGLEHKQLREWLEEYKVLKDRATPKKPKMMRIKKYDGYNIGICECGNTIDSSLDDDVNFCHKCGQALDWSDEE